MLGTLLFGLGSTVIGKIADSVIDSTVQYAGQKAIDSVCGSDKGSAKSSDDSITLSEEDLKDIFSEEEIKEFHGL